MRTAKYERNEGCCFFRLLRRPHVCKQRERGEGKVEEEEKGERESLCVGSLNQTSITSTISCTIAAASFGGLAWMSS